MSKRHERAHIHIPGTLGEKVADLVVSGMGSWRFIIIQTAIVVVWIVSNVWLLTHPFDPYPMILLNLVFSTQAAYASPIILMAANRQASKDRQRDNLEASEVDEIAANHKLLVTINQEELEILRGQPEILSKLSEILDLLKAQQPPARKR